MERKSQNYPLNQSPFFRMTTKCKLANLLKVSVQDLRAFNNSDRFYNEHDIPKKQGGVRHIENPKRNLKVVQARIARLLSKVAPPDYLFCPVRGRCYVTNASRHSGNRIVRTLDIKKYFPNTPKRRVYWFFRKVMKCNSDVAEILADIASYKGHLPTGSPLSPIMAFYAYYDVWEEVDRLVKQAGVTSSLYVDDLTISGVRVSEQQMWKIKKVIHRSGLRYHKEKKFSDHPAEVTGVVLVGNEIVPPNRQLLKRYRAERAIRSAKNEQEKKILTQQLKGLIEQASQISTINSSLLNSKNADEQ